METILSNVFMKSQLNPATNILLTKYRCLGNEIEQLQKENITQQYFCIVLF